MSLNRQNILEADDLKRRSVKVPEWGGDLYVREMTAMEAVVFDVWLYDNKDNKAEIASNYNAMLVMLSACDEAGHRIFEDSDLDVLRSKNPKVIGKIARAVEKLNKLGQDDFEDDVKNSKSGQTVASISG